MVAIEHHDAPKAPSLQRSRIRTIVESMSDPRYAFLEVLAKDPEMKDPRPFVLASRKPENELPHYLGSIHRELKLRPGMPLNEANQAAALMLEIANRDGWRPDDQQTQFLLYAFGEINIHPTSTPAQGDQLQLVVDNEAPQQHGSELLRVTAAILEHVSDGKLRLAAMIARDWSNEQILVELQKTDPGTDSSSVEHAIAELIRAVKLPTAGAQADNLKTIRYAYHLCPRKADLEKDAPSGDAKTFENYVPPEAERQEESTSEVNMIDDQASTTAGAGESADHLVAEEPVFEVSAEDTLALSVRMEEEVGAGKFTQRQIRILDRLIKGRTLEHVAKEEGTTVERLHKSLLQIWELVCGSIEIKDEDQREQILIAAWAQYSERIDAPTGEQVGGGGPEPQLSETALEPAASAADPPAPITEPVHVQSHVDGPEQEPEDEAASPELLKDNGLVSTQLDNRIELLLGAVPERQEMFALVAAGLDVDGLADHYGIDRKNASRRFTWACKMVNINVEDRAFALREMAELYRLALEKHPNGIVRLDPTAQEPVLPEPEHGEQVTGEAQTPPLEPEEPKTEAQPLPKETETAELKVEDVDLESYVKLLKGRVFTENQCTVMDLLATGLNLVQVAGQLGMSKQSAYNALLVVRKYLALVYQYPPPFEEAVAVAAWKKARAEKPPELPAMEPEVLPPQEPAADIADVAPPAIVEEEPVAEEPIAAEEPAVVESPVGSSIAVQPLSVYPETPGRPRNPNVPGVRMFLFAQAMDFVRQQEEAIKQGFRTEEWQHVVAGPDSVVMTILTMFKPIE